jgi:hypothetical protein
VAPGTANALVDFTVGDAETPGSLVVTKATSNTALVPDGNLFILSNGGAGQFRLLIIPVAGQVGSSTITLQVSDGSLATTRSFVFSVSTPNTAPSISTIANQGTLPGQPTTAISFTVGDAETAATSLVVSASSSNPALVPKDSLFALGTGSNRTLIAIPAGTLTGTSTITVVVSDGSLTNSTSFVLTVGSSGGGNTPPTISNVPDLTVVMGGSLGPIPFTVSDAQTPASNLVVSATSTNPGLIPVSSVLFGIANGGGGSNRTMVIVPATGQSGTTLLTVTVSDGTLSTNDSFVVTVTPPGGGNTAPTISEITDRTTPIGQAIGPVAFVIGDKESTPDKLTVTGRSSNQALIPDSNIQFSGALGANRSFFITPVAGGSGTATITVVVSDGALTNSETFLVTVGSGSGGNTPPSIALVPSQTMVVGTVLAPIAFTVGDSETPSPFLTVNATSSDQGLVTDASLVVGGSFSNRTITITPVAGRTGTATITLNVSDGTLASTRGFLLTVTPPGGFNTAPTISDIPDRSTTSGTAVGPIPFIIGDTQTPSTLLTLSATSSNPGLVPNSAVTFGGLGANRSVTVSPLAGQSGVATITVTVSDGTLTASDTFVLTVTGTGGANTPPTIANLPDATTPVSTQLGPVAFTIGDAETPVANLTVAGSSSNTSLVPNSGILFAGTGATRQMVVQPATGQSGTATITVTVSDGQLTASDTFVLTVGSGGGGNTKPTITAIGNQMTPPGTPVGPISFTIGDVETPVSSLTVTGSSSVESLVPSTSIQFAGSGATRAVIITPAPGRSGSTTITLTVRDAGDATASTSFELTVDDGGPENTAPTISNITNKSANSGTPTPPIPFTVGDAETLPGSLLITGGSSNTNLVPVSSIQFGGTGANRTVIVTPAAGQSGTATVLITVSDGELTASDTFLLTVTPGNTAPSISTVANQQAFAGVATAPVAFTVGDAETSAAALQVSATSSNADLLPASGLVLGGAGANRTIVITPATNQVGTATVSVVVSDGALTATNAFTVTITRRNNEPTISPIGNLTAEAGKASAPIAIVVGDDQTPPASLQVTAVSANTGVLPAAGLALGGTGANRTLVVTPAAGQSGVARVTVTVNDGELTAAASFDVTVTVPQVRPSITQQPANAAVRPGANATFTVVASGSAPLNYQWLFEGVPIPDATQSTLTISNAHSDDVGNYSVVVSNPVGLTFSAVAKLQLRESVRFAAPRLLSGGLVRLEIAGEAGETYELQTSSDLSTWRLIAIVVNATGTAQYIDPDAGGRAARFYRALVRP